MADEAGDLPGQPQAASEQRLLDEALDLRPPSPRDTRREEPDNFGRVAHNDVLIGANKKKQNNTKNWSCFPSTQEQRLRDE